MKIQKKQATIIRIVVSLSLLAVLAALADTRSIAASLAAFRWPWLAPVLALIVGAVLASAVKWGLILRAQGAGAGLYELFRIYSIGFFFNNFLPSSVGGDGARVLYLGKRNGKTAAAAASVVAERAMAAVTLALVGGVAACFSAKASPLAWPAFGLTLLAGAAATALVVGGRVPGFVRRSEGRAAKAAKSFAEAGALMRRRPDLLLASGLVSALFQVIVAAVNMAVLAGLGAASIGFVDLCYVVSAASILAMIPVGVNGYGLREGAYAFLLAPYGLSAATSVSASVIFALCVSAYSLLGAAFWLADSREKDDGGHARGAIAGAGNGLVSIIIPVLDDREGLDSLIGQLRRYADSSKDRDLEIVVSDGGSADGSDDLALERGAILVRGEMGRGGQLGRGVAASRGSILLFLHADSSIGDDLVPALRAAISAGAEWGCASLRFDAPAPSLRLIAWGSRARARLLSLCFGDQGIYCLRTAYEEVGGFPDIPLMEDVEISRRLKRRARARVLSATIVTSARRFRDGGVFRVFMRMKAIQALYALGASPRSLAGRYRA